MISQIDGRIYVLQNFAMNYYLLNKFKVGNDLEQYEYQILPLNSLTKNFLCLSTFMSFIYLL